MNMVPTYRINEDVKDKIKTEEIPEPPLPYFPGYEFKNGKSTYKGFEVGEGGFVYAEPGVYGNVRLLDIASMHPNSMLNVFDETNKKRTHAKFIFACIAAICGILLGFAVSFALLYCVRLYIFQGKWSK